MIVGVIIFIFAVFVVLIGTKESEAIVLYYDLIRAPVQDNSLPVDEEGDTEAALSEDQVPGPEGDEEPQRVTVTVGGSKVNQGKAVDDISAMRKAAKEVSPNKRAQDLFDSIKN